MTDRAKWVLETRRSHVEELQASRERVGSQGTSDLNRAIIRWLESCRHYNVAPPEELIQAVTRQLKVDRRKRNESDQQKRMAAIEACVRDPDISISELAKICGVTRPTIRTWKREDSFKVAWFRKFLDANPKFKGRWTLTRNSRWTC